MINPELKESIRLSKPFSYLEIVEIDKIITYCDLVTFNPGDHILKQGKHGKGMYILIEGQVLATKKVLGTETLKLATLEKGSFFGEASLIEKILCPISVIANNHVQCLLVTTTYFDMLSIYFPETRYKISKAITEEVCNRLRLAREKIKNMISKSEMATVSLFDEFLKSFSTAEISSIQNVSIDTPVLKNSDFFNSLSENEFNSFLSKSTLLNAPSNCRLITTGEIDTPYFIVLKGAVQSSITHENKMAKLSVMGPISIICSISNIDGMPAGVNYVTCEHALIAKISIDEIKEIQKTNPDLWYKLFNLICRFFVSLEISANKLIVRLNSESYNR